MAGVNLVVLAIHGAGEGFRWQLAFVYGVVVVLALVALARVRSGRRRARRGASLLRFLGAGLCCLGLAASAFLAHALPVFTLPAPTGTHGVGFKYFHLVDPRRADPFLADPARRRELRVKVYYPAESADTVPYAPYFNGSAELLRAYARFYQLPDFAFSHFALVRTHSRPGAALATAPPRYPVVLFSHGAGATLEVATAQGEDLASHGYIVVAVDHPYVSAATVFPERVMTHREATTDFAVPEPAVPISQIMTDDLRFVIEQLGHLDDGTLDPAFRGRLALDQFGVIGHSIGGAAAYDLALTERRVGAAINLDGAVYLTPSDPRASAPLLMIANDKYHAEAILRRESLLPRFDDTPESQQMLRDLYGSKEAYDAQYRAAQANSRGLAAVLATSGAFYTIAGSDHMKFTDIGLFIGERRLRDLLQIGGPTDPARCLTITQALTVAFFDQHLKGAPDTTETVVQRYPELRRIPLE